MKRYILFFISIAWIHMASAQDSTLTIYSRSGDRVPLEDIVEAAKGKKLVCVGELHGQSESHRMEALLLKALHAMHGEQLALGMEMFEADVQPIIKEYFLGLINTKSFESESRVWNNYADYRPIVEFAKTHGIALIATNIPRRYANSVYHHDIGVIDQFPEYALQFMPELPLQVDTTLQSYQALKNMVPGHAGQKMLYSQAIKDATMAKNIERQLEDHDCVLHLNGAYHTDHKEGIISHLRQLAADDILVLTTILDENLDLSDVTNFQKADFTIISTPKSTKK